MLLFDVVVVVVGVDDVVVVVVVVILVVMLLPTFSIQVAYTRQERAILHLSSLHQFAMI